jgi:hypothetical protein
MIRTDTLNTLAQSNLHAMRQWADCVLETTESAWKAQMDAADEISQTIFTQWREASAEVDAGSPLSAAPKALTRNVERSTQVLRSCVDTAIKLQTGLAKIAQDQMPVLSHSLGAMWLAPWSGLMPAVTEFQKAAAEHGEPRQKKAA